MISAISGNRHLNTTILYTQIVGLIEGAAVLRVGMLELSH